MSKPDHGTHRPCRACGRKLWIVMGPAGKPIPLDLEAQVYDVLCDSRGSQAKRVNAFVSHFATCTDPSRFSKKPQPPAEPVQQELGGEISDRVSTAPNG